MRMKPAVIAITIYLVGAALAFAQSAPPPPALPTPSAQSAVHVTTRLVQVSVTVQDAEGRPIKGLTKDDFFLTDDGRRQEITSISEGTRNFRAAGAAGGPNHFTNQLAPGNGGAPPLTVIVLDAYNTAYYDQYWRHQCPRCPPPLLGTIFNQVEKFIGQMQPQDRVAIYELTTELLLLQDFTGDASALERGVNQGKEYASTLNYPPCAGDDPNEMSTRTMAAMHSIADRLAKIPGRKNLVWLSVGFHHLQVITDVKMDTTVKAISSEDLPLFAIDAHGLDVPPPTTGPVPRRGARGPASGADSPTPGTSDSRIFFCGGPPPGGFDAIKSVSEDSGGRAFYDTNDFAGAIRRVIDTSAASYVVDYYPDHNKWNGEFREIKVKVNRRGVEVRARRGYYAVMDTAAAPEKDAERLAEAVRSPVESTDLGFDVEAEAEAEAVEAAGARQVKLKITLDANQLHLQQQGDRWTDNVTEYWAQFDSEGQQVSTHSQTINLRPSQGAYKQLLQQGLNFSETISLEKNATEVRLVLRDAGNGAIGSVIIPLARLFATAESQMKK
jgi:VWFA-related protein